MTIRPRPQYQYAFNPKPCQYAHDQRLTNVCYTKQSCCDIAISFFVSIIFTLHIPA